MAVDLSKELAQVLTFAGNVFIHIRFCGWHAKSTGLEVGVERMTAWADMAHNLAELGPLIAMYLDGDETKRSAVLHTCDHLVSVMTRRMEREADWEPADNPINYCNGIYALKALAAKLRTEEEVV